MRAILLATLVGGCAGVSPVAPDAAQLDARPLTRPDQAVALPDQRPALDQLVAPAVTTYAGTGQPGQHDGPRLQARFETPQALAIGADGELVVVDSDARCVRRIRATEVVTEKAACGAALSWPLGLAVLPSNAGVLIADFAAHRIKLLKDGVLSTFAGGGCIGQFCGAHVNGARAVARFAGPAGVALDAAGRVYVADMDNHAVRVIDGDTVGTLAGNGSAGQGDGPATGARLRWPTAIAVDAQGTVYVFDSGNKRIARVSAGSVTTVAAQLPDAQGLAVDGAGDVFVSAGHRILRIRPQGELQAIAGEQAGFADGSRDAARFDAPVGLAAGTGGLFVADSKNHRIRQVQP